MICADAANINPKLRGLKNCYKCENSHKRKDFEMKKILVVDVPEHITEVSISYSNLLGARFEGRAKLHALPKPKKVDVDNFIDASIQMCQDAGYNKCIDDITNLSE